MKPKFKDMVGGKIKEYKDNIDNFFEGGYIITKDNKKYFLGFTDPHEVYLEELGKK